MSSGVTCGTGQIFPNQRFEVMRNTQDIPPNVYIMYQTWATEVVYNISYIHTNEHVTCLYGYHFISRTVCGSEYSGKFSVVSNNCHGLTRQNVINWRKKGIIYQWYEHTWTSQYQPMWTPMSIVWFDYIMNINMYTCVSNYTSSIKSTIQLHLCPEVHDNAMMWELLSS